MLGCIKNEFGNRVFYCYVTTASSIQHTSFS